MCCIIQKWLYLCIAIKRQNIMNTFNSNKVAETISMFQQGKLTQEDCYATCLQFGELVTFHNGEIANKVNAIEYFINYKIETLGNAIDFVRAFDDFLSVYIIECEGFLLADVYLWQDNSPMFTKEQEKAIIAQFAKVNAFMAEIKQNMLNFI